MERSLLWSALAVGILGCLYCWLVLSGRQTNATPVRENLSSSLLALALALPVFVFCITLPDSPPFGAGQGFGRGFLLGSVGALLAIFVILRATAVDLTAAGPAAIRSTATLSLWLAGQFVALVVTALPLLFLRATIIDTLLGVACGWLAVTLVLVQGLSNSVSIIASASGAGFAITLCAVSAIGVYRDFLTPEIARGTWSSLAVAFAAGVPISFLFSEQLRLRLFPEKLSWKAALLSITGAAVPLLLFANLLAFKIIAQPRFSIVVAVGLLAGLMMWWAVWVESSDAARDHPSTSLHTWLVPTSGFVMLAGVVVAFGLLQGFGIGLMLLAAWPAIGFSLQESRARSTAAASANTAQQISDDFTLSATKEIAAGLLHCFLFGVVLLLERLFEQRFRTDLRGVAITDYYALLGFLLGAGSPSLLASWLRPTSGPSTLWLRVMLVGVVVLTVPAALMIVWSIKTSFALFFGLALACLLTRGLAQAISLQAPLLALALALLMTQWTHRLLPLAEMTRSERLRALGAVIILLLILVIVGELTARFSKRQPVVTEVPVS